MSNILSTLKVKFSSDTSELKKGADQGKAAIQDMTSAGKSSLDNLAGVFGTSLGDISSQISGFRSGLASLSGGFSAAASGSGGLTGALKILKIALISTGIGAIVVALGALVAYFTKTKRGADIVSQAMDAIGAIFAVITDRASALGEAIINAFENPKQAISDAWDFIKNNFVNRFTAIPLVFEKAWKLIKAIFNDDSFADASKEFLQATTQMASGLDAVQQNKVASYLKGVGQEMGKEASAAYNLKKRLNELEDAEIALKVTKSDRKKQIAQLREFAKLESNTLADRKAALQKALNFEQANLDDEMAIVKERADIIRQQKDLGENMRKDDEELAAAQARINELETESLTGRRRMITELQTLTKEYDAYTKSIVDNRKKQDEYLKDIRPTTTFVQPQLADGSNLKGQYYVDVVPSVDYSKLVPDTKTAFEQTSAIITANMAKATEGVDEFAYASQTSIINMSDVINSAFDGMAMAIGESIGNMMAGTEGIAGIGTAVLSALAEMLITVGKMAIATGIAVIGIKEALMSLNPAVAIAAGIALVALGTAVKSGLSSAASGGSGGMSSVSAPVTSVDTRTASNTSQSNTASIAVEVAGEFRQRGSDLVAVVGKENNRKSLTT
ncbi:MAG: hypothetical protein JXR39_11590 [Marinilabiliaceae bacterium]|nr:hypothetical protein [Marinilabiliaceae bacterium]